MNILYVPLNEVDICPEYISKRNFDKKHQVVLLKIGDDTGKWHFLVLPSNLDDDGFRRLKKSISRLLEDISSKSHDDFYCFGCFHSFRSESALKNHVDLCKNNKFAKIELPNSENNFKKYKPGAKSLKMNTVIYADFESILVPYSTCDKENETNKIINKHVPCGYSINVVNSHNNTCNQTYYRGYNAVSTFCKEIRAIAYKKISFCKRQMIELTLREQKEYEDAKYCHICKKVLAIKRNIEKYAITITTPANIVVPHIQYAICVILHKKIYPCCFYDFNLIITELAKEFKSELQCIPVNTNKYMSFSIPIKKKVYPNSKNTKKKLLTYNLKFIDSVRHMNESLSKLVDNLSEINKCKCDDESLKNIKVTYGMFNNKKIVRTRCKTCKLREDQLFSALTSKFPSTFKLCRKNVEKFLLLIRKGVYPYEYMDNTEKFNEKGLPTIDKFYSKLAANGISTDDYKHAKKVWDLFKISDLGEYHDLYVCADAAQLSDVFESFRSLCLKEYDLDPTYFVSTPSLTFEAMLKLTRGKIELFTDVDMVLMTEKVIGGGLTQVIRKDAIANNKYLPTYDRTKKSVFLQYLDASNLYGYAMCQKLPLDGYKWGNVSIFTNDFVKNYDLDSDKGYLLEVDVEYPKELHGAHEDLPFLPEKRVKRSKQHNEYEFDEITKAHKKVYKTFNINNEPDNKLIATVQDKNKYVVHISTLKQALNHGLRLQKVHRVIEFNQSAWLKPYIDKNTALRKLAKNEFEKDFFKLMNNSVFGKMIENVRKRRDIKLIVTEERRKKLVSEPNYASCTTFSDHLMAIEMRKTRVLMDKPILAGQAILDKSKELMYDFWYEYLKPKYFVFKAKVLCI